MPLPRSVARLNKRYTNRFIEPLVRRWSRFAVVHHVGRRSGAAYETPVTVFELDGSLVVALTYGLEADWVKNVLCGPSQIERSGSLANIARVEVVGRDVAWAALPLVVRAALRVMSVTHFLLLGLESDDPAK